VSDVRYRAGKRLWSVRTTSHATGVSRHEDRRLAVLLRRTTLAVSARAGVLGLHKSATYLASPAACRLRRGQQPATIATRFKKGHPSAQ
jgi:hypothetical protein